MKRIIFKILRFFLKLFLIICGVIVVALILFVAFPEKITTETIKRLAPNIYYSVGNIAWRKNGADFYDLKIILPGATGDFHRVSFKIKRKNYFVLDVTAYDGNVNYTPVKFKAKKHQRRKTLRRKHNYFDDNPIKFLFRTSNVVFNTLYGFTGKINAESTGFFPNLLIEKFECEINAFTKSMNIYKEIKAEELTVKCDFLLRKPMNLNYKPKDRILYYLNAFEGEINCNAKKIATDKININNGEIHANIKSGEINFSEVEMNLFGGKAFVEGDISRRKVKGKNKWRFKYNVNVCITNINAMDFCDAFKFRNNKLGGIFSGCVKTSVFGSSVKLLDGKLQSDRPGILYFPEAEKYISGMQESMQKQIFDIMVERLKMYPYSFSIISLKYDLKNKTTEIDFEFSGTDQYKFKLFYDKSWIDAIKLAKALR